MLDETKDIQLKKKENASIFRVEMHKFHPDDGGSMLL
jgi:hypothetical protein